MQLSSVIPTFVWSCMLKDVIEISRKSTIAKRSATLVYVKVLTDHEQTGIPSHNKYDKLGNKLYTMTIDAEPIYDLSNGT